MIVVTLHWIFIFQDARWELWQTHADSHDATANLDMSEQLQENEQEIDRPAQEEDDAAYAVLDHTIMQENHMYDVISW